MDKDMNGKAQGRLPGRDKGTVGLRTYGYGLDSAEHGYGQAGRKIETCPLTRARFVTENTRGLCGSGRGRVPGGRLEPHVSKAE